MDDAKLPMRLTAHSMCFRAEAGSYGRAVRGMIRQHQFEKVEIVAIARPHERDAVHEQMVGTAEAVLDGLGLPYRRLDRKSVVEERCVAVSVDLGGRRIIKKKPT